MKSFVVLMLMSAFAFALPNPVLNSKAAYELNKMNAVAQKYAMGSALLNAQQFGLRGKYVVSSTTVGAVGAHNLLGMNGETALVLPNKAIITGCVIDIVTAFTSAGGAGTIALNSNAAGDIKAAVDADTLSGRVACIPVGTAATMIKMTADRTLQATVAVEALTAGQADVFIQYALSE